MATKQRDLRLFLLGCFFLFSIFTKAQYHFVNDIDGFVNVRMTPEAGGKIVCQLTNGTVVRQSWNEDTLHKNWIFVEFYLSKAEARKSKIRPESPEMHPPFSVMTEHLLFTGYIYKDRLTNIEQQESLISDDSGSSFRLYNGTIEIILNDAAFDKKKHKIEMQGNFPDKIDGRYFAGTDGTIPRYEFKTFSVEIGGKKIDIPRSSYNDLYEPNLNRFTSAYVHDRSVYIIMRNSDGAGVYEVIFIIKDKKYIGRYVFHGEC